MKPQKVLIFILCSFLVLSLVFVIAEKNEKSNNPNKFNQTNHSNHTKENNKTTYGTCVAAHAKEKNLCYKVAKNEFKTCNVASEENQNNETDINDTLIKDERKNCREIFKNALKVCKSTFKLTKKNCEEFKCKGNETFVNETCVS